MKKNSRVSFIEKYDIKLRPVDLSDADFIVELRTDKELGAHLSATSSNVESQKEWIRQYKLREDQGTEYYFIAVGPHGERYGTTRVYNIDSNSFEIGSWIFSKHCPAGVAVKTDIAGREFGFNYLKLAVCKFQVRKSNLNVIKYHMAYNPEIVGEDDLNFYYELSKEKFSLHSEKLIKILS